MYANSGSYLVLRMSLSVYGTVEDGSSRRHGLFNTHMHAYLFCLIYIQSIVCLKSNFLALSVQALLWGAGVGVAAAGLRSKHRVLAQSPIGCQDKALT